MKKTNTISLVLWSLFILPSVFIGFVPETLFAQGSTDPGGLIVCDGVAHDGIPACGYSSLILLFTRGIDALIKYSTIFVVVLIIIAGFRLLTSGGDPGARKDAKNMFFSVLKGYVVILIAWLLVYTILKVLIDPAQFSDYSLLGNPN